MHIGSLLQAVYVECDSTVSPRSMHHPDNAFYGR
jgi:hypothetical protein